MIDRQVGHLNLLIEDLLDVSRVARGKIRLNRQHVDASSVIPGAIEKARPLITSRKHTLELDVSSEPMPLFVDPARIEQVLANLLTNAAKYTPDGGHICITAKPAGDSAILAVRDNGIGIAPEMLSRVFDLFVQGEIGPRSRRRRPGHRARAGAKNLGNARRIGAAWRAPAKTAAANL